MWKTFTWLRHFTKKWGWRLEKTSLTPALCIEVPVSSQASERYRLSFLSTIILMDSGTVVTVWFFLGFFFYYICITPRHSWNIVKVGVKQQSINQSIRHMVLECQGQTGWEWKHMIYHWWKWFLLIIINQKNQCLWWQFL